VQGNFFSVECSPYTSQSWGWISANFMFFAFKKRITDYISHAAGFSIFLNIKKNSTMRKHCSNVCKLRPCLDKESNNLARNRTIRAAALQRQYSQTELSFWIIYVNWVIIWYFVDHVSLCITIT
jgi:hypothetical protein